jgi:type VI secretion system ImpA family protein
MARDIEALLAPIEEEAPSGPDMSYDDVRIEIESAFESSFSDEGARAADFNWLATIDLIDTQMGQTKDIWLAVYLMRAGAFAGQLETVVDGAAILAGMLDRFWDTVHPQLDEYGLQGRVGPCQSLASIPEFLGPLRRMALVKHARLGAYSSADFERFAENGADEDGYGMFRAAMQELGPDQVAAVFGQIETLAASLNAIDGVFTMQADGEGPNLSPLHETLKQLRTALKPYGPADVVDNDEDSGDDFTDEDGGGASASSGGRRSGKVDSREDVIAALDAIGDYYRRREPSSPVPLALQRARNWVTLDFMTILKDIAPAGMTEADRVLTYMADEQSSGASGWSEE